MASASLDFDVASALAQGRRETQEDAIATDFPIGAGQGFVVLADGMGGHCAGEVASKIVVTEVFSELKLRCANRPKPPSDIAGILRGAARTANECLRLQTEAEPKTLGMGSTLVALVQRGDALFWVSIGDSLLYLYRDGVLRRLNADHSLAPQIDLMVENGVLSETMGRSHPDRNCLTSALTGEPIASIDCPDEPLRLQAGDVVVAASDGLQFLAERQIGRILADHSEGSSEAVARALLGAISVLDDPDQDNVCFSVVKAVEARPAEEAATQGARRSAPRKRAAGRAAAAQPAAAFAGMFRRLTRRLL